MTTPIKRPRGRPRKLEKYAGPINLAEAKIAENLPRLIDKALELAEGVTVQEIDRKGEAQIYTRPPDREAIKYLIDRLAGKPTERVEVDDLSSMSDDELIAALSRIGRGSGEAAPDSAELAPDDELS